MITGRRYFTACTLNGKIYVFGGSTQRHENLISNVEEYDPATDTWTRIANMPHVLAGTSAVSLNGKFYVSGGTFTRPESYPSVVSTMYVYDPGDVPVRVDDTIPVEFELVQNYPNPFNPSTTINYRLDQAGMVNLVIYDLLGQKVATLVDEVRTLGNYTVRWNAQGIASGIYICRVELGESKVLTQKMLLLR